MRIIYFLGLTLLTNSLFAQNFNHNKITEDLLILLQTTDQEYFEVFMELDDQVDLYQLDYELVRDKATPAVRSEKVITAMEDKAAETQGPLLNFLKQNSKVVQSSVRSFWISNTVFAEVHRDVLAKLSNREDLAWLYPNHEMTLVDKVDEACYSPPSPNGHEFGHTMIKATKLWQMGYTGYGSSALVVDTGTDGEHPALKNNYKGKYYGDGAAWTGNSASPRDFDDSPGHGTHVTGTVLGLDRKTNDTIGVAFNALWMAAPPIGPGNTTSLGTFATFQWALNPDDNASTVDDRPDAINNSWSVRRVDEGHFNDTGEIQYTFGAGACNSNYTAMINTLEVAGVAVVFSAGNQGGFGESTIGSPMLVNSTTSNAFCVGAVNSGQAIAGFSSRGPSLCASDSMAFVIKPEVSAPGVNVRSSFPNGQYGSISGTSMAAPHVTGAVCLLKSAFPQLIGRDFLEALYITAVDKGTPGEDNAYGNGIINLLAAFNYLVDQGNIPADPLAENDILLVDLSASEIECAGNIQPIITVENAGSQEITSFQVTYGFEGVSNSESTATWTGSLMAGERTTYTIDVTSPVPPGDNTLYADITMVNEEVDERQFNGYSTVDIIVSNQQPIIPFVDAGDVICENSSVALRANPLQFAIHTWYDADEGGTELGTGNPFVVEAASTPQTYYMETKFQVPAGIPDTGTLGTPEFSAATNGEIIFDALSTFTLKSVKVFAPEAGPRVFKIINDDGATIGSKLAIITSSGEHVIAMNVVIPQGEEYRITLDTGKPLWYTKDGLNYPYMVSDVVSIKRSSNVLAFNYYYYFYDWQIEFNQVCGRAAVDVVSNSTSTPPTATFEASITTIDLGVESGEVSFTNNSTGATSYAWDFGDGSPVSNDESPTHLFTQMGTYVVTLTTNNADGCTDVFSQTIEVSGVVSVKDLPQWAEGLRVFPNPSSGNVYVEFDFDNATQLQISITDLLGKPLQIVPAQEYINQRVNLDLSNFDSGVYFFVFEGKDQVYTRKVVLMD